MTSRKKSSGFEVWLCVISAWPWCICPPNFAPIALSNSELLTFSEIQDGGRHHLGFSSRVHVNSVVLELYIKFNSNICDSHWTYALDVHLMTFRELTSGFDFWSGGYLRMAVVHLPIKFGVDIYIQSRVIDIFRNSKWRPPPSWIFSLCEFGHSGVLIVWYLYSVPNLVQIYVIVTEIDAHML